MKTWLMALSCLWIVNAQASIVHYEINNISGNRWEYSYEISNDTLAVDIEEFSIYFDFTLYENLAIGSTPSNWDPLLLQPDPGLPDDGIYDALALSAGIAPGDSLGGFSVLFDYLGTGTPGNQAFDILDPFTFAVLDSGTTQQATSAAVPEPSFWMLLASGLIPLTFRRQKI